MVGFCLGIRVSGVFVGKGIEKRSERVGAKEARIGVRDFLIITALKVEMISIHRLSLIYMRVPSLLFLLIFVYCFSSQGSEKSEQRVITYGIQYRERSIETIRGERPNGAQQVVFRHVPQGFANNMMVLLSSYVVAMILNLPLVCECCIQKVTYS